jgi:hypothetical protein
MYTDVQGRGNDDEKVLQSEPRLTPLTPPEYTNKCAFSMMDILAQKTNYLFITKFTHVYHSQWRRTGSGCPVLALHPSLLVLHPSPAFQLLRPHLVPPSQC